MENFAGWLPYIWSIPYISQCVARVLGVPFQLYVVVARAGTTVPNCVLVFSTHVCFFPDFHCLGVLTYLWLSLRGNWAWIDVYSLYSWVEGELGALSLAMWLLPPFNIDLWIWLTHLHLALLWCGWIYICLLLLKATCNIQFIFTFIWIHLDFVHILVLDLCQLL